MVFELTAKKHWNHKLCKQEIKADNQGEISTFLPRKEQFQRRKCPPSHRSACLKRHQVKDSVNTLTQLSRPL